MRERSAVFTSLRREFQFHISHIICAVMFAMGTSRTALLRSVSNLHLLSITSIFHYIKHAYQNDALNLDNGFHPTALKNIILTAEWLLRLILFNKGRLSLTDLKFLKMGHTEPPRNFMWTSLLQPHWPDKRTTLRKDLDCFTKSPVLNEVLINWNIKQVCWYQGQIHLCIFSLIWCLM